MYNTKFQTALKALPDTSRFRTGHHQEHACVGTSCKADFNEELRDNRFVLTLIKNNQL